MIGRGACGGDGAGGRTVMIIARAGAPILKIPMKMNEGGKQKSLKLLLSGLIVF